MSFLLYLLFRLIVFIVSACVIGVLVLLAIVVGVIVVVVAIFVALVQDTRERHTARKRRRSQSYYSSRR